MSEIKCAMIFVTDSLTKLIRSQNICGVELETLLAYGNNRHNRSLLIPMSTFFSAISGGKRI